MEKIINKLNLIYLDYSIEKIDKDSFQITTTDGFRMSFYNVEHYINDYGFEDYYNKVIDQFKDNYHLFIMKN